MSRIEELLSRAASQERTARHESVQAHEAWFHEVVPTLRAIAATLESSAAMPEHRFEKLEVTAPAHAFEIHGKLFSSSVASPSSPALEDDPSRLVFSMAPSGEVTVLLYPHHPIHALAPAHSFITAIYPNAGALCGLRGRQRIHGHIALFLKLSTLSSTLVPKRYSYKLLNKLERNHDTLERIFRQRAEYRTRYNNLDLAIGVGIGAALYPLIFSNFLPAVSELAKRNRDAVSALVAEATTPFWSNFIGLLVCMGILIALKRRYS